jgi:hypothetical protein
MRVKRSTFCISLCTGRRHLSSLITLLSMKVVFFIFSVHCHNKFKGSNITLAKARAKRYRKSAKRRLSKVFFKKLGFCYIVLRKSTIFSAWRKEAKRCRKLVTRFRTRKPPVAPVLRPPPVATRILVSRRIGLFLGIIDPFLYRRGSITVR